MQIYKLVCSATIVGACEIVDTRHEIAYGCLWPWACVTKDSVDIIVLVVVIFHDT